MTDRLAGVTTTEEAVALSQELSASSSMRSCVLEVVRPLYGTRRIINSDNYYTSVQLLEALRLKGLYARGTVRKRSAHFPKHVILNKKTSERGTSRQACIKEYNTYIQGVDRLDQIRGRLSLADGHSFKKWHEKLGLALIDIGRSNAYLTRRMALGFNRERDSHRDFVIELISELLSGKWKDAPSERRMFYDDVSSPGDPVEMRSPASAVSRSEQELWKSSEKVLGIGVKAGFPGSKPKTSEGRGATEVTDYCVLHGVSLCQHVFASVKPHTCPQTTWTCWEKYHRFYLQHKVFSTAGRVRTSTELYKKKLQYDKEEEERCASEGAAVRNNDDQDA
ncbi:Transposase, partial [Phytophthora palmivora]